MLSLNKSFSKIAEYVHRRNRLAFLDARRNLNGRVLKHSSTGNRTERDGYDEELAILLTQVGPVIYALVHMSEVHS